MENPKRTRSSLGRSVSLCSQAVRAVLPGPVRTLWRMNGTMVWAWMHCLLYARGRRKLFWFGHGCTGCRMLLKHERNHGLGINAPLIALISEHERNSALGMDALPITLPRTQTLLWFGHGCTRYRTLLEHERTYCLGMDALLIAVTRT